MKTAKYERRGTMVYTTDKVGKLICECKDVSEAESLTNFLNRYNLIPKTPRKPTPWKDNRLQFARLISEAEAVGCFEGQRLDDLANEMDLTRMQVCELIDRAQAEYDKAKKNLLSK